ncbi:MAG TPA: formylmethanofuran dehydrogenase, partial [Syntrophomonadaceae bacterium]|nr:formylmethanofuran dehydrogenase [Syntrophomonadaceae bacterium]
VTPNEQSFPEEFVTLRDRWRRGELTPEDQEKMKKLQLKVVSDILQAPQDELLQVQEIQVDLPEKARIFKSVPCAVCGEMVMEPRARVRDGKFVCIPCSENYSSRVAG